MALRRRVAGLGCRICFTFCHRWVYVRMVYDEWRWFLTCVSRRVLLIWCCFWLSRASWHRQNPQRKKEEREERVEGGKSLGGREGGSEQGRVEEGGRKRRERGAYTRSITLAHVHMSELLQVSPFMSVHFQSTQKVI